MAEAEAEAEDDIYNLKKGINFTINRLLDTDLLNNCLKDIHDCKLKEQEIKFLPTNSLNISNEEKLTLITSLTENPEDWRNLNITMNKKEEKTYSDDTERLKETTKEVQLAVTYQRSDPELELSDDEDKTKPPKPPGAAAEGEGGDDEEAAEEEGGDDGAGVGAVKGKKKVGFADDEQAGGAGSSSDDDEAAEASAKAVAAERKRKIEARVATEVAAGRALREEAKKSMEILSDESKYPAAIKHYENIPPAYKNRILYSINNACQPNFYYSHKINFLNNYPVTCIIKIDKAYLRIINININIKPYFNSVFLSTIHTILNEYSKEDFLILNLQYSVGINIEDKSIIENPNYTLASYHIENFTIGKDAAKIHLCNMFFIRKDIVRANQRIQKFEDYTVLNNGNFVALKSKLFLNGEIFYFVNVSFEKMAFNSEEKLESHYYDFYKSNIENLHNSLKLNEMVNTMGQVKDPVALPFARDPETSMAGGANFIYPNFFIAGNFESMSNALLTFDEKPDSPLNKQNVINDNFLNKKSILARKPEQESTNYIGKIYSYPAELISMIRTTRPSQEFNYDDNKNNKILNEYFKQNYYIPQNDKFNELFKEKAVPEIIHCTEKNTSDSPVKTPVVKQVEFPARDKRQLERTSSFASRSANSKQLAKEEALLGRTGYGLQHQRIGGQNLKKSNNKKMSKKKNHNLKNNNGLSNKTRKIVKY